MITTSAHLEELRKRLLVSFGTIFLFAVLAYFFAEQIARFFMMPLFSAQSEVVKLVYTNLTEAFITYLKTFPPHRYNFQYPCPDLSTLDVYSTRTALR